jgi:hypothetical protein
MKSESLRQRIRSGDAVLRVPEQDILVPSAGRDAAADGEASADLHVRADLDALPDDAIGDGRAVSDRGGPDHASPRLEAGGRRKGEDPARRVEIAASGRERSAAVESFERRAEEIARSAEIVERPRVQEPADFVQVLPKDGLPLVGDESALARRDQGQDPRGHDADAGVKERTLRSSAETRDSIPFGLKRRVPVGIPIQHDQERCRAAALPVPFDERREVRLDDGVGVQNEKIAAGQPFGRISERAGGAEDFRLREEANIREIRRAIAQLAFDLFAKMMKVDARFEDAVARQKSQVLPDKGDV